MRVLNVDLCEFFMSGRLDGLALGMPPNAVRALLGPPEDIAVIKGAPAAIWRYGNLQVHCTQASVELMQVYFLGTPSSSSDVDFGAWAVNHETSTSCFQSALNAHGIPWRIDPLLTQTWQLTLEVGVAGVHAVFADDLLQKIGIAGPLFGAPTITPGGGDVVASIAQRMRK